MLYDTKWDYGTKDDTVARLVAWLEGQNPRRKYDYFCFQKKKLCLLDSFVGYCTKPKEYQAMHNIEVGPRGMTLGKIAAAKPSTFGAALKRIKAELK